MPTLIRQRPDGGSSGIGASPHSCQMLVGARLRLLWGEIALAGTTVVRSRTHPLRALRAKKRGPPETVLPRAGLPAWILGGENGPCFVSWAATKHIGRRRTS